MNATLQEIGPRPGAPAAPTAAELTASYRPERVRLLFIGEASPAGSCHFYRANSQLFRATRDAFVQAITGHPSIGGSFLDGFQELGCWLVDLADVPFDELPDGEQEGAVEAAIARLAALLQDVRPERAIVVLRRIAPAVQAAAEEAGLHELAIDVLPFPVRQWRPVYIEELAAIVGADFGPETLI